LPDDATVTGYALDVNGTLIDAVPIEKEKAKVVFEEEVRSRGKAVAVVEMAAQSNSFKTSIYPLHPNQKRIVRVEYTVAISTVDNLSTVVVPFGTPSPSADVHASIDWKQPEGHTVTLQLVKNGQRTDFKTSNQLQQGYNTSTVSKSEIDETVEAIVITSDHKLEDNQLTVEGEYFCARMKVEQPQETELQQPNKVQILYDASYSRRDQQKRDTELLTSILNKVQPKEIVFTPFSVEGGESKTFAKVDEFLTHFGQVIYDGATNLHTLETLLDDSCDYCVAFTDGLHTIGKDISPETVYSIPMYVISSTRASNAQLLSHIATKSGGLFMNATSLTNDQIASKVGTPVLYFLVADYEPENFEEVYPNEPVALEQDGFLHLYGKIKKGGEMNVMFRYGRETVDSRVLEIEPSSVTGNQNEKIIPSLWAKQKLNSLSAFPQLFDQEMRDLAMEWKIVTANTSLIVMESLDQYIKHGIVPPTSLADVHAQYMSQKKKEQQSVEEQQKQKIRQVLSQWEQRKTWHKKDFSSVVNEAIRRKEEEEKRRQKQQSEQVSAPTVVGRGGGGGIGNRIMNLFSRSSSRSDTDSRSAPAPMMQSSAAPMMSESLSLSDGIVPQMEEAREMRRESSSGAKKRKKKDSAPSMKMSRSSSIQMDEEESLSRSDMRERESSKREEAEDNSSAPNTTASIQVQKWSSDQPYMGTIKASQKPYETYLELRKGLQTSPAFFLDVADHWLCERKNEKQQGLNILTNILELELESEQLLRIVGYRLDQEKYYELAELVFAKVKKMRPDEPQSYRDLALVKEKLGKLEEAADLLNQVIYKKWDHRFDEVELTAAIELNHVLAKNPKLPICDEGFRYHMDLDLRVSMVCCFFLLINFSGVGLRQYRC
jgi:glutaredoxin